MTKILVVAVLTPIILLSGGVLLARRAHREKRMASLATQIMVFAVVFSMLSAIVGVVLWSLEKRDYDNCIIAVDGRNGVRELRSNDLKRFEDVQEEIAAKTGGQVHLDSLDNIVEDGMKDTDRLLPARSRDECPAP